MKNNKTKIITIAALIIAVIALSIGFAAFASTLNISTGASVTPTNTFSVKFASSVTGVNGEFTEFSVTPDVAVTSTSDNGAIAGTPEIDNTNNPSIGNLSASFTAPGQSVTYTFYVVNDGNYDAYLTNLVFNNAQGASSFKDCVSDSLSSNPATQSLVDSVCNNITFTMSVGNDSNITGSTTLTNHLLEKSHYELVTVTIAYQGSAYADGAFKVNFGDIDLNYRTIDEVEEVQTPTPLTPEPVEQTSSVAGTYSKLSGNLPLNSIELDENGETAIVNSGENSSEVSYTYNSMNEIVNISDGVDGMDFKFKALNNNKILYSVSQKLIIYSTNDKVDLTPLNGYTYSDGENTIEFVSNDKVIIENSQYDYYVIDNIAYIEVGGTMFQGNLSNNYSQMIINGHTLEKQN